MYTSSEMTGDIKETVQWMVEIRETAEPPPKEKERKLDHRSGKNIWKINKEEAILLWMLLNTVKRHKKINEEWERKVWDNFREKKIMLWKEKEEEICSFIRG